MEAAISAALERQKMQFDEKLETIRGELKLLKKNLATSGSIQRINHPTRT